MVQATYWTKTSEFVIVALFSSSTSSFFKIKVIMKYSETKCLSFSQLNYCITPFFLSLLALCLNLWRFFCIMFLELVDFNCMPVPQRCLCLLWSCAAWSSFNGLRKTQKLLELKKQPTWHKAPYTRGTTSRDHGFVDVVISCVCVRVCEHASVNVICKQRLDRSRSCLSFHTWRVGWHPCAR